MKPELIPKMNMEIIEIIEEHSEFVQYFPMALFYCLYFCIYYNNEELVEFLRGVITKVAANPKIDRLIEYIDIYGIPKLRAVGE
mmetsp:Transcript_12395/g.19357  ORF Transcript_12395/g.19357 Transcript_12395/m.19357 type:complete len:84 (+) Transcript_12395:2154-2405(+)